MKRLEMKNCSGKLQYCIIREAAKVLALSSSKIDKYEYLTGEILSPDQSRVIEQGNFNYSPLGKSFEKQIKTIEEHGKQLAESTALDLILIMKKIAHHLLSFMFILFSIYLLYLHSFENTCG